MANKQAKARIAELKDLEDVMRTMQGRRVMNRLLGMTGLYQSSYHPDGKEGSIYFNEGRRNVGLMLMAELQEASPSLFNVMTKEHLESLEDLSTDEGDDNENE